MPIKATFIGLFALLLTAPANAAVLYTQTDIGGFSASQFDTASASIFAIAYDNFTLGSSASITSIDFTGEYDTDPPEVSGFTLSIFSDSSGPATLLYSQIVPGNANETLVSGTTFTYGIDLTSPFATTGGTPYWVSIVADLPLSSGVWGWNHGTGGDAFSLQDTAAGRQEFGNDLAFTLNGTSVSSVPEPFTLSLFGVGLAGAAAIKRRRKKEAA